MKKSREIGFSGWLRESWTSSDWWWTGSESEFLKLSQLKGIKITQLKLRWIGKKSLGLPRKREWWKKKVFGKSWNSIDFSRTSNLSNQSLEMLSSLQISEKSRQKPCDFLAQFKYTIRFQWFSHEISRSILLFYWNNSLKCRRWNRKTAQRLVIRESCFETIHKQTRYVTACMWLHNKTKVNVSTWCHGNRTWIPATFLRRTNCVITFRPNSWET